VPRHHVFRALALATKEEATALQEHGISAQPFRELPRRRQIFESLFDDEANRAGREPTIMPASPLGAINARFSPEDRTHVDLDLGQLDLAGSWMMSLSARRDVASALSHFATDGALDVWLYELDLGGIEVIDPYIPGTFAIFERPEFDSISFRIGGSAMAFRDHGIELFAPMWISPASIVHMELIAHPPSFEENKGHAAQAKPAPK